MKKNVTLNESQLRSLIDEVLNEDSTGFPGLGAKKATPPPLPNKKPASAALPQKGALHKFKADVNMMADAAGRVKQAVEGANTKEALRWLEKVVGFAKSAQAQLSQGSK